MLGSTGLRPWKQYASDWCYRSRATGALDRLAAKCSAPFLLLSYNDDGQISHDTILHVLSSYGSVPTDFPTAAVSKQQPSPPRCVRDGTPLSVEPIHEGCGSRRALEASHGDELQGLERRAPRRIRPPTRHRWTLPRLFRCDFPRKSRQTSVDISTRDPLNPSPAPLRSVPVRLPASLHGSLCEPGE